MEATTPELGPVGLWSPKFSTVATPLERLQRAWFSGFTRPFAWQKLFYGGLGNIQIAVFAGIKPPVLNCTLLNQWVTLYFNAS